MARKWFVGLAIFSLLLLFTVSAPAQESTVKGGLAVTVLDPSGAVVPDAKVTVSGPTGTSNLTTNASGQAIQNVLNPGMYSVKVEKQGFKTATLSNIEVLINRTSGVRIALQTGTVNETVEVASTAITVDTQSTAVSTNIPDTVYSKIPVQRNVTGLFYIAPGAASGGASGAANPSISGGSGLENQYVADGVDITDAAFGGLGIFSRSYGSLGTGINLSFIKEVQIKTAGFEPQYGRATGGIVQIVTKSGSNEYHGAISTFLQPKSFEAARLNPDDPQFSTVTKYGRLTHDAAYDVSGELGGYVPGLRNHVFFFGSYNPSWTQRFLVAPTNSGLFSHGTFLNRYVTNNYAFKGTLRANDKNQFEFSIFGDPAHTSTGPFRRLRQDNNTGFSKLEYGTRNMALRWNATLSPTWLFNASATWGKNNFNEIPSANLNEIIDQTQLSQLPGQRGEFIPVGLGFIEPTTSNTYGLNFDTSKTFHAAGEHTFSIGYHMERPFYDGKRAYSGPTFIVPPGHGATAAIGQRANALWRLFIRTDADGNPDFSCTLCPLMNVPGYSTAVPVFLQIYRSEFGIDAQGFKSFRTSGRYHAAYANDSWSPNKYVNLNIGLRWEQQLLKGEALHYTFTDNWSPRIGVSIDPKGDRKTKIFGNFGRYTYAIPLDMAERSLTNELDFRGMRIAPAFTTVGGSRVVTLNQYGTVTPIVDAAHILNNEAGGIPNSFSGSSESTTAIYPGTRMSYEDEFVAGAEHEFPGGIVASVKFVRRDLKRIVEDTGGISPEAALAGVNQTFTITNVGPGTDVFSNPIQHTFTPTFTTDANGNKILDPTSIPAVCGGVDAPYVATGITDSLGNALPGGNICVEPLAANGQDPGANVPDGIPDGFPAAIRQYTAVEMEVNKAFAKGWLLRANWRIAKLYGNFEGALRNDNGQTDPSISSLYDFTAGNLGLLGDQFKPGPLNTDRRHIVNTFFSYTWSGSALKGLTLGSGVQFQTGTPINELAAHPVYENPGEVPIGGRGALGRLPFTGTVDVHADYSVAVTEKGRLMFGADLFNIGNARRLVFNNQNIDQGFGTPNPDFLKPFNQVTIGDAFQSPFSARAFLKFVF